MRTDSRTIKICRKQLKSVIQSEVRSAVDATQPEDMSGLLEKTLNDICNTGYCAATDGMENSSLLFVENVTAEIIYR